MRLLGPDGDLNAEAITNLYQNGIYTLAEFDNLDVLVAVQPRFQEVAAIATVEERFNFERIDVATFPAHADDMQDAAKLLKAGQHQQALERVNKALASKPRDPQARFLKGLILTEQGNTREAIDIFSKLTQDYPELPEPYNNLAVIYASQGQYEKARTSLEQSIRTHPSYARSLDHQSRATTK